MRDGRTLDRFASMPGYFTDDAQEVARLTDKYAGRPPGGWTGCPAATPTSRYMQTYRDNRIGSLTRPATTPAG